MTNHDQFELQQLKSALREKARVLGFEIFGVARARRLEADLERLRAWLERGDAARMASYLGRRPEERTDPVLVLEGARSVVVVGMSYAQAPPDLSQLTGRPEGRIARFALGRDYHDVLGPRLEELARWLEENARGATPVRSRCFVDSGPLLERAFAREAGLGWIGKNTCLIHPRHGSWFVLGALVTTAELPPDAPVEGDCGDCRLCLDACPSGALCEPFRVDARRCLSYLTIETREPLTAQQSTQVGDKLFGCDACQAVCPYNQTPLACADRELMPSAATAGDPGVQLDGSNATLGAVLAIRSNREFERLLEGGPLARARKKGLQRNARVVAANLGREDLNERAGAARG